MSAFFEWQNLIFGIALLLGGVLVVGSALGLVDSDPFASSEADVDAEHGEAAPEASLDSPDATHDTAHDGATSLLAALGIGRAPLSVFVTTYLFAFGAIGLCSNMLLAAWLHSPLLFGLASLVIATAGGLFVARAVSKTIARFVPSIESYATDKADVIGSTGVAETSIGRDFGMARVTDATGSLFQLKCRACGAPIDKGAEVLVVEYDPLTDFYLVDNNPIEPEKLGSAARRDAS